MDYCSSSHSRKPINVYEEEGEGEMEEEILAHAEEFEMEVLALVEEEEKGVEEVEEGVCEEQEKEQVVVVVVTGEEFKMEMLALVVVKVTLGRLLVNTACLVYVYFSPV